MPTTPKATSNGGQASIGRTGRRRHQPTWQMRPWTMARDRSFASENAHHQSPRLGWSVDDEESEDGLVCVAARVPLAFGALAPRVAISVTGLQPRMAQYGIERTGGELLTLIDRFEFGPHEGDDR
jgi:DNA-binding IclR family transcriptional regulator